MEGSATSQCDVDGRGGLGKGAVARDNQDLRDGPRGLTVLDSEKAFQDVRITRSSTPAHHGNP
jgi:hypothetical protein